MTVELLLDNSAWARLSSPTLAQRRANEIAEAIEQQRIATCLPFILEAGYSARSWHDHDALMQELATLPSLHIDDEVGQRAVDAQGQLARAGHHQLAPVDLLLAALADHHGVGIVHYDHDYDIVVAKTDLRFESVWLAPRGTL